MPAVVLGLALALAGCSTPDNASVIDTANTFFDAVGSKDGTGACLELSKSAQAAIISQAGGGTCPQAFDQQLSGATPTELQALMVTGLEASQVVIDGDTATIAGKAPGGGDLTFVRESGSWKLDLAAAG